MPELLETIKIGDIDFIRVKSKDLPFYIEEFKRRDVRTTGINVSTILGYELDNLDFLKKVSELEALIIQGVIQDVSTINILEHLKYLSLDENTDALDFANWKELSTFHGKWNNKFKNLDRCTELKTLWLWKYNPKSKSLDEVALPSLNELQIVTSAIASLEGIERAKKIKTLKLDSMSKLENITALSALHNKLERLELTSCKKITSYESLSGLHALKRLELMSCGELPSLKFMKGMDKLEFISFIDTNLVDGDISPVLDLPNLKYVGFNNKKHYSHKFEEIEEIIATR